MSKPEALLSGKPDYLSVIYKANNTLKDGLSNFNIVIQTDIHFTITGWNVLSEKQFETSDFIGKNLFRLFNIEFTEGSLHEHLVSLKQNGYWHGDIIYNNPIAIANNLASELKKDKKCDLVICLSHLGFEYGNDKLSDKKLAAKTSNIDVIIGGHTHTFLPKPITIKNADNKEVIINQVGWAGLQLGKIDFYFDSAKALVNTGIGNNVYINQKSC